MSLSMYIYPHQGIASFHPTSKDSLCGAQGRRNRSMHLCHIYRKTTDLWRWQITQADQDCAHMWKVDGGNDILLLWISLSFIWITWGHGYLYFFFFFSWTLMCPFFFSFFLGVILLGHAIFSLFLFFDSPCLIWKLLEREIIKHGVLFCGWMEWHSWLPV